MEKLLKRVESIFDTPPVLGLKYNSQIQLETNFELIKNISYFDVQAKNMWNVIAGRLSPFFDGVLLIEKQHVQEIFFQNQKISHPVWKAKISWPNSDLFSPLRTDAGQLSKKLFGERVFDTNQFAAFVIHVDSDTRIVLFSAIAEPWLSMKIENMVYALQRINFES